MVFEDFFCLCRVSVTPFSIFLVNLHAERPDHLWLGADISGTTFDEARGIFTADTAGNLTENTRLMKQYGMDAVRLRVWVDPRGGWSAKEDVLFQPHGKISVWRR